MEMISGCLLAAGLAALLIPLTERQIISMANYYMHPTSIVDEDVEIGDGTKIWHFSHIQSGARVGKKCSLGQNVNVSNNVKVGDGCKVQNNVSLYEGVELENYVFCGPSMVFTNDLTPRSRYPKGRAGYKRTLIRHDATLGANCTVVCGCEIGEFAMIAAGAVVTKDVLAHALMAGVPAKQIGWVCECGQVLNEELCCPDCGRKYAMKKNMLKSVRGGYFLTGMLIKHDTLRLFSEGRTA